MIKKFLFCLLLLNMFSVFSQNAISGYVNIEDETNWEQKVHLSKIYGNKKDTIHLSSSAISKDGYFSFDKKHISDKNTLYQVYVNRIQKVINDTIVRKKAFILSNKDSIHFKKGTGLFSTYKNSSLVDAEWQRLKKYESRIHKNHLSKSTLDSSAYVTEMKSYTKDSLQILMVKLISIKQLENKNLLDIDIVKNPKYYISLLSELKKSDLERSEYLFLEKKLAFLTNEIVERKYQQSKTINIILGILVMGLIGFIFYYINRKRNLSVSVDLSKQEKNIQNLILEGKSNKEIANELFISVSTVKTHITNIYSKLSVSSRKELLQNFENSTGTST